MTWLETVEMSSLAQSVAMSRWAPALLSSVHLIGLTLVLGGAVASHLRLAGWLLADAPPDGITRPGARLLTAGLIVSLVSGSLLVLPRLTSAVANPFFVLKMSLLAAGLVLQVALVPRVAVPRASTGAVRVVGYAGLVAWLGVAAAGCAFILLE